MKCGVFSELSVLWEEGQTAYRLGWGTVHYSKNEWRRKEKNGFQSPTGREPSLWLNWNGNGCSFIAMVGGKGLISAFLPVTLELLRHGSGVTDWKWLFRFCCSIYVKCHRSTQVINGIYRIKVGNKHSPLNVCIARIKWDWPRRRQMTWRPFRQYRTEWLCDSKRLLVLPHTSDIYKHINLGIFKFPSVLSTSVLPTNSRMLPPKIHLSLRRRNYVLHWSQLKPEVNQIS